MDQLLASKDTSRSLSDAKSLGSNKLAFIYGCGPSLEKNIKSLLEINAIKHDIVNVAADGAISALLKFNINPHISVTDLDGDINDLVEANNEGSISFVHAHGDNIPQLKAHVEKFKNIIGTTQTRPIGKVSNFGGFTDGDRAAFIAEELGVKAIFLIGFDFGKVIGKYSKPKMEKDVPAGERKIKKLKIAKSLIKWLSTWSAAKIFNLTGAEDKIRGIKNVAHDELNDFISKLTINEGRLD